MSIIIKDIKIKNLIRNLQANENNNNETYEKILSLISEFIYNFPRIKYYKDIDICSEFYLYTVNYLPDILIKFNIKGKATFQTWFAVVLVNIWRNFLKTAKNKEKENNKANTQSIENLNSIDRYGILQNTIIKESVDENESIYVGKMKVDSLSSCFQKMPKKVRVTVKAHFFELFTAGDIEESVDAFQLDFMATLRKYEVIVTKTRDKYKKISDLIDELNNTVYELNNAKNQFDFRKNDIINADKYRNKIERLENFKTKKIDKLKSMYIKLSPKEIAGFFNTNANSVSNLLHRGKNYIIEYFKKIEKN